MSTHFPNDDLLDTALPDSFPASDPPFLFGCGGHGWGASLREDHASSRTEPLPAGVAWAQRIAAR